MKPRVILGLGNPGAEYENTPHNMGAAAARAWAGRLRLTFEKGSGPFIWTPVRREARAVSPTTYMNVSGMAVSKLIGLMDLKADELLVLSDDVWLPLGRLRLRTGGSDGGHNGLKSVAEALGSENYPRLRLGVGPVPDGADWADYVLRPFPPGLQHEVDEEVASAAEAVNLILARGYAQAQNTINRGADETDEKSAGN
jgi:PTH1 family peptidyl-tRNA hydrolase